jgi:hypothetical protein
LRVVQVARVTVLLEYWMCRRSGVLRNGNGHLHARRKKRKEPTMPKVAGRAGGNAGAQVGSAKARLETK